MSASGKIMRGDFPPHSTVTFFKLEAASYRRKGSTFEGLENLSINHRTLQIALAVPISPVNDTFDISGCRVNICPCVFGA